MSMDTFLLRFCFVASLVSFNSTALSNETAILFGTSQPILFKGFNAEVDYFTEKLVFEYSHGVSLKISDFKPGLTKKEKDQDLKIYTPWTTGGGIGYRWFESFHTTLEYKVHKFEVTHPKDGKFSYVTQTLGVGAYYNWKPFGEGFTVVPALRYWPTIASSLEGDKKTFADGQTHEPHPFSFAPNVKLGWTF